MKKIKDFEQKCKPLQEKNKKFLEKNMELTTQNRSLKEQIRNIADENKKLKDNLDLNKRKCNVLTKQLSQEKLEKGNLEVQIQDLTKLKNEIVEKTNMITSLKQAAAEKDRRMEVLQHRKKRRLRMSSEHVSRLSSPCSTIDDERSQDSDLSTSSVSAGNLSDDDVEELPQDEAEKMDKNYKKLMKEHLLLEKSTAQLQNHLGWKTDPQRYFKSKLDFETDMYIAQCKIENLEECLAKYKDYDNSWVIEKEELVSEREAQNKKIQEMKKELRETTQAYEDLKEQTEHLEFLVLETQESKSDTVSTEDVSTSTDDDSLSLIRKQQLEKQANISSQDDSQTNELVALQCSKAQLKVELEMSEGMQQEYKNTIRELEDKLKKLLNGQDEEVSVVMQQLKDAEQDKIDLTEQLEKSQQDVYGLTEKLSQCERENSEFADRIARYKGKLDSQEQSLALTRDEREELLQVKPKPKVSLLNNRLRLAEMGQDSVRERSLEREGSLERICSPLMSPRSVPDKTLPLSALTENQPGKLDNIVEKEVDEHFESLEANMEYIEPVNYENLGTTRPKMSNMIGADHSDMFREVDTLQRRIQDLQEENDVLKFELTSKGHGDSGSGSDSEDTRVAELRETCENLKERLQSAEATERQCKDRLKLAEKHITELEQAETVLRDRVEEGNSDCDKLRKQIVRLQRKIRELKDTNTEKDAIEQCLLDKVKFLEDAEAQLSQKVTELESTNHMLKQRLDVKDELLADVQLVETLTVQVKSLQSENNNLESKMIDLEVNNEFLRENWRKVADEEANRRECLEEKIKVLECANKDLKAKLKDHETDLDLSSGPSIASEINDDAIEQLNERIKELENDLELMQQEKEEKVGSLHNLLKQKNEMEEELKQTIIKHEDVISELNEHINTKKSEQSECLHISTSEIKQYQDEINELTVLKTELTEKIEILQKSENDLKSTLADIEKEYESKIAVLNNELLEYKQNEDMLRNKVNELEENENNLHDKLSKYKESEMNFKNKIEELENRETSLTIQFSKRMEELEKNEKEISERFYLKIEELECKEKELSDCIDNLESENKDLTDKVNVLESREKELENKERELVECVEQLASEKTGLLEKVNSLEKHEKELPEKDEIKLPEQQEHVELVHYDSNTAGASVVVQDKYESATKLESEASVSAKINNQRDTQENDLRAENESLMNEISTLRSNIQDLEKEHKALEDKFKRMEKKRKRSERADNVDDYDTIAREVVTYKLEVDQLRTENNDLHERVMELDESEKNLLEQNEQLTAELKDLRNTTDSGNDMNEINELKQAIKDVRQSKQDEIDALHEQIKNLELKELKQSDPSSGNNIAIDNGVVEDTIVAENENNLNMSSENLCSKTKETADKNIGTDDFMEGVMAGQDQGKPVSSMFERIQTLENENQDLSVRLSAITATDAMVKQLSEKVKSLEENEDSLMERVMELEDEEDRLKRELSKLRQRASSISELEEELTVLQENEEEMNSTIETLKLENETLKKTMDSSTSEKGDIAIRLANTQKMYEDEKKKVESLLQGEERWMKSVSSEKKAVQEMETELANTQEKLEELQTEYENKLSEKEENEKLLKDEVNRINREKELLKKKFNEYEKSNSELEDEIEACKISESRMFHRHQQLITQNEELELKLSKLEKLISESHTNIVLDTSENKASTLMAENPEVISENPLSVSVFSESELELLRNKTPDAELLGSVPLDMLRKMQDFDQREQNYQSKIHDMDAKTAKLTKKIKVMQVKEKDLKHENKQLQLELLKLKGSDSDLRASTSSLDFDRSGGSDDGLDSDTGLDDKEVFDTEDVSESHFEGMTQEELLLTVKLQQQQSNQDRKKMADFEEWLKDMIEQFGGLLSSESFDVFIKNAEALTITLKNQNQAEGIKQSVLGMLEIVTSLRQKLEAIQDSEEKLRISLAEKDLKALKLKEESEGRIEQLEAQIHAMTKLTHKYQSSNGSYADIGVQSIEELPVWEETETGIRCTSSLTEYHLEPSKTINIDVPPSQRVQPYLSLDYSETVNVNVPPSSPAVYSAADDRYSNNYQGYQYDSYPAMMDKAEDVLRQRIRELEKLEKHLRQQVSDLETDREELHEIARKDKAIIHDQNVKIRELQLAHRNFQEQIKNFESSENSLYARLDELEVNMDVKDDRIRDLEILEQRLKDLVKQYKLDEKILQTKSQSLESSVKEMSVKEETLKQKVQNLETEKSAFSERSEYLQTRLKELEYAETDLAQRAQNQENIMQTLQNTVIELETFGANAHARVIELEQINFDLQQRLHHSMTENSPLSKQSVTIQQQCDRMKNELSTLRDSEIRLKQENESLIKSENGLQHEVKALRIKEIELEGKVRDLMENDSLLNDKLSKLQRSENTLKYRVHELENSGIQAPSDLNSSQISNMKLPRTLEDCQRRIIVLQTNNAELQSRLQQASTNISGTSPQEMSVGSNRMVPVPQAEYQLLQRKAQQMEHSPGRETMINDLVSQLEGEEVKDTMVKATSADTSVSQRQGQGLSRDHMIQDLMKSLEAPGSRPSEMEDDHWREIETRMEAASNRGGEQWINVGKATSMYAANQSDSVIKPSHGKSEVLELGIALQSETDSGLVYQNDTDSGRLDSRISPRSRQQRLPGSQMAPSLPQTGPPMYIQSSAADSHEEISDQTKEMFHRRAGNQSMNYRMPVPSISESMADSGRGTASIATSGMTLRERISYIEKQLSARESDSAHEFNPDQDITSWKARVQETNRKLELAEKESKHFKDEINKLEKELEEKTKLYKMLESFLKFTQSLLQQKTSITETELIDRLEAEVEKVTVGIETSDYSRVETDPATLNTELAKKDRELNAKRNEVDSLMRELRQWQEECRSIESMRTNALDSLRGLEVEINELQLADKQLKDLKDDYNTLKGQSEEDSKKTQSSVVTAPLRSRIVQLTNLCNEKDVLIKKLVQELKRLKSGARSSPLVDELCRLDTKSDHNHNLLQRTSSQSSIESLDKMSVVSDTELLRDGHGQRRVPRPRSADIHQRNSSHRHSYHGSTNLPRYHHNQSSISPIHRGAVLKSGRTNFAINSSHFPHSPNSRHTSVYEDVSGDTNNRTTQYVAIADYDPSMFSQSGHPRLELSLKEGDIVLVTGPMHDNGYVEGEVRGQVGLVPLSYLQASSPHRSAGGSRRVPEHLNASPERIAQLYKSLHDVHQPNTYGQMNGSIPTSHRPHRNVQVSIVLGPLDAPENFHAEKIIGNNSIMLAWEPVHQDNHGYNKDIKVTGYRIYKDNKLMVQPRGRLASKAIIENINIQTSHRFGIQTVGAEGQTSELSEIMYEGVEEVTSDENSDTESEMDMNTVLNVDEYKSGNKRLFMGVYDYDPSKNSPYDHPSCELSFNAGEVITVYGRQRGDGFYYGEINGVRGLVPTFFIEEMPQPPPRTKKMAKSKQTVKGKSEKKTDHQTS
ncbi:hypothetical protein ACF0H5_009693 [Mactra antiquata]